MENLASFKLHGNYVGPGHTGAAELGKVKWSTRPIDALDNAARSHDWRYAKSTTKEERSEADFQLAKDALNVADSLDGLAKAKAYLVGYGMLAKGLADRGVRFDGSQPLLQLPPPSSSNAAFRPGKAKMSAKQPPPMPLVGIETNPGPKSKGNKGVKKNKKKMKSAAPKRKQNVSTSSSSRAGSTLVTGTPIISVSSSVLESLPIRNFKVKLDNIVSPTSIIAPGQVFFSVSIDRMMFARTALSKLFGMFAKYRSNGITFEIVPSLATNTAGLVQSVTDPDALDLPAVGSVLDDTYFSGHGRKALEHSAFGETWRIHLPGSSRQLFTDVTRVTPGSTVTDPRNSSAGTLVLASSTGFATVGTTIGAMYAYVNFDFSSSGYGDDDAVVSCVKASALTGSVIAGPATTYYSTDMFGTAVNSGTAKIYQESSYQQFFYDGTYFNLPRGVWYVKLFLGFSSNPGTVSTSFAVAGSPVYSLDWIATSSASNSAIPEYLTPPGTIVSQGGSWQVMGKLRVTQPSAGARYLQFAPNITITNSVSVVTVEVIVERMATVLGETNVAQFPKGNSGSVVEYRAPASEHPIVRTKCIPTIAQPVSMSRQEYEQWMLFKASQSASADVVVVDRSGKDESKAPQATAGSAYSWWPAQSPRV